MLLKKDKMVIGLLSLCMSPSYSYGQEMVGIEVDTYTIEEIYQSDGIVNSSNIYASKESSNKKNYTNKRHSLSNPNSWEEEYTNWKNKLAEETGFSYSFDMSILGQRGAPNGKGTSIQFQAYPSISWELFDNEYGTGTINASYTPTRYWNSTTAQDISDRIDVLSAINDYSTKSNSFDQLSYTQQFAGDLDWFSITIGQFPIYNFDGTNYDANQQINFLNYALSQNASSTYPLASLGAYFTFTINSEWEVIVGMQDANNVSGTSISANDFGKGEYTSFASISYAPIIKSLGAGQYSILVYNQPSVTEQEGTSNGWSLNFEQALNEKLSIFGRINGAENSPSEIEQSYVLGSVLNNPLNRNALDQIGFAAAINKANKDIIGTENTRDYETVLETYWAWGIGNWMTITPDLQFYFNPALDRSHDTATVASLRTTLMF